MSESREHWLHHLDLVMVRRLIGRRTLEYAIASDLRYVIAPTLTDGGVRASLREVSKEMQSVGESRPFEVEARMNEDESAFAGSCSRCLLAFGPCVHIATLAVDLACSDALRETILARGSSREVVEQARAARFALAAEMKFDAALRAWIAPSAGGIAIEMAVDAFAEEGSDLPRAYGDRTEALTTRVLAISVRRAGERKLMAPRDATVLSDFGMQDRRILEYARDRGVGRKAVYASGLHASLAIEAMRAHGNVFSAGFKSHLDFRSTLVRPRVRFSDRESIENTKGTFAALSACWVATGGEVEIAFDDAAFFPGPFPYVWTKDGAIYRVAADVDLTFAAQLANAPKLIVPPGKLRDAGAELFRATRGRGIALPSAETFGLPSIEAPRIALRLSGEPLAVEVGLVAAYRAREVDLVRDTTDDARAAHEGRDVELEGAARAKFATLGIVPDVTEDEEPNPLRPLMVRGERAVELWSRDLPMLRASDHPRIEIELSKRLSRVRIGAPLASRVHVVLEGDWLKARLEFASRELPVEIADIRAALLKKERWVALQDGTLAQISSAVESLVDEANEVMPGAAEAKLPPHQLGRLDRWIEENDGRMDADVIELRKKLRSLAVNAKPKMPRGLKAKLRPYQKLGLSWLQFLDALGAGGILADDMGLGKTLMTLAFLQRKKEDDGPAPSLIVCPTSVASNWAREASRFTPGFRVHLLHGTARGARKEDLARAIENSDAIVTTYALLRRDIETLSAIRFRAVVLDEAQNIKNADSETRRAAVRLDAGMRLALSGTPMENRLHELWSIASFANPGILGTSHHFEKRFERPITSDRDSPIAAELRAIVRPFLLRRRKDDVLPDLPPKTEIDRFVTLTSGEKRMYDALAHTLRESVARDIERRTPIAPLPLMNGKVTNAALARSKRDGRKPVPPRAATGPVPLSVFTALTRLRQMACDPMLIDPEITDVPSAKRETFLELVRELIAEGRRALVFSQFVQLLTLWRRELDRESIRYEYLDGSTTKRDEVVTRFQEGNAPLFLISLKAGGAGINLTAADTVIHCDPWWNPAVEDQATDRTHRIGQEKPVTVVRLIARGTIEEKIISLKAKKRELVNVVLRSDAGALEGLKEEDIRMLLGDASDVDVEDESTGDENDVRETIATKTRIVDVAEYELLVKRVARFLRETGQSESTFALLVDLPIPYASRLARGEPFPCSRAVAHRIHTRIREFR